MLMIFMGVYTLYVLFSIYTSVMQIGFINQAKRMDAVLLSPVQYLKAGNYAVAKEKLAMARTFVDFFAFVAWIGFGISYLSSIYYFIGDDALKNVVIVMTFLVVNFIIGLPFSYYEKFVLDQEYGFNKSTKAQWIKDTFISFVMMLLFGSLVVWGVYLIIKNFELWWLWSFLFIFGVIIVVNMLYPAFRAMFFDKLSPLEDTELKDEIQALMDKTGFVSSGVYVSDASKRDARLNAYFGGFGKAKRVVLFDTLLEKLSKRELLAVLGHELGHFAHGDVYKNIAMMGAMLFAMFAFFGNLPQALYMELGLPKEPYVIMILFLLMMPVLGFIMMPIMGFVSRKNEYAADKMGSELGGIGGEIELANALKKLVEENKSFPLSHPIYIFFHYTHPPVIERLKALGMDVGAVDKRAIEGQCNIDI